LSTGACPRLTRKPWRVLADDLAIIAVRPHESALCPREPLCAPSTTPSATSGMCMHMLLFTGGSRATVPGMASSSRTMRDCDSLGPNSCLIAFGGSESGRCRRRCSGKSRISTRVEPMPLYKNWGWVLFKHNLRIIHTFWL
jgi:hypothetical protein